MNEKPGNVYFMRSSVGIINNTHKAGVQESERERERERREGGREGGREGDIERERREGGREGGRE